MRALDHHDPNCDYTAQSRYNGEDHNDRMTEQAMGFCEASFNEWLNQLYIQNTNN